MSLFTRLSPRPVMAAAMVCVAAASIHAQEPHAAGVLRVATGPMNKVYERMAADMQSVCGSVAPVQSVTSTGGLHNLSLLSANQSELGIVQVDTLRAMVDGDENIRTLQAVMPLHNNLLHVLTLSEGSKVEQVMVPFTNRPVPFTGRTAVIRKFSELKGLSVAVVGSAQLMGKQVGAQLGHGMQYVIADNDEHALALLRMNQVQAVFTLGGWPLPSVTQHSVRSGLYLAEFDLTPQTPYIVVKRNYQDLDAFNRAFLAVPNLLVTRPFKPDGAIGRQVGALQSCLRQRLDALQEGPYQPAWKEIKDLQVTYNVPPFAGATRVAATDVKR